MEKQIIYVNKGLANFYSDHIEINKSLKSNKKLRDYIVKHELGHKESFDLMHEFKSVDLKIMPSLIYYILIHPSTWYDFSPIQFKDKQLVYDLNLLILYSLSIILLITLGYITYLIINIK